LKHKESKGYSKWGWVFLIPAIISAIGSLWVAIRVPEYISEGEMTTMNIPFRYIFILWLFLILLFIYAQIKDSSLFQLRWPKNSKVSRILGSILAIPTFSLLFSFAIVHAIFSVLNYTYVTNEVVIKGKLYKKEITESRRRRSSTIRKEYYIYFNEDKRYCLQVGKHSFTDLEDGDSLELKVLKGRLNGYYITDSFSYSRWIPQSDNREQK
tara:strand:- start:548 stop:1180 length:633 start_codon:yes stop_codon:yes gene_type:complete